MLKDQIEITGHFFIHKAEKWLKWKQAYKNAGGLHVNVVCW